MKNFVIKTHGCKANQLESVVIQEKLIKAGYAECKSVVDADIFILNSCSVTETADNEALRTIRNVKNKNRNIFTVLTGCSAQLNAVKALDLEFIDLVLGNDDKFDIVKLIEKRQNLVTDIFSVNSFNNQLIHYYNNTRGYLKIQDGCNNYCSYCTIILARGKSRSNSIDNIIEQVNIFTKLGIKELVLTGIHIGQWGLDFSPKLSLINLLEVLERTDIVRYRLGSLNILELDNELIDFLSKSKKFCPHFHLSIQSLNDNVLRDMNRHYEAKACLELIQSISAKFDKPFIGSDIIVGFPGESEVDFEMTFENVKNSNLSNIHVFPYSIRKNTKAAGMPNQLSDKIKRERAHKLQELAREKYIDFVRQNIGSVAQVLIEKRPDKHTGQLKGVTQNYLNVLVKDSAAESLFNTIQQVRITEYNQDIDKLIGEIV